MRYYRLPCNNGVRRGLYFLFAALALICFLYSSRGAADDSSVVALVGTGLKSSLFELREMDMHLHAGMEREMSLDEWIDLSVSDGRKVLLLLDHLELHRMDQSQHDRWIRERKFTDWYPIKAQGHKALMDDFIEAGKRQDVLTFRGWEVSEAELDEGLEIEPMKMAEVIGWHISPNNGGEPPDGKKLVRRVKQIIEVQKQIPVPMILFHPFSMRIENLQRTAQKQGRDVSSITEQEYRFFKDDEQEELAKVLQGQSIYIEVSYALTQYWNNETVRQAVIKDVRPLVNAGIQFTVSTDAHGARTFANPFNPHTYCDDLGITPANTNGLVRELLAMRAMKELKR